MKGVLWGATMGLELATAVFVGAAIGYFIDTKLKSAPWGIIIGVVIGAMAGFWNIYKVVKHYEHS
jgi:ATP synthase protein I